MPQHVYNTFGSLDLQLGPVVSQKILVCARILESTEPPPALSQNSHYLLQPSFVEKLGSL